MIWKDRLKGKFILFITFIKNSFPKKTTYEIRDEDQRYSYNELDSKINFLNFTIVDQTKTIENLRNLLENENFLNIKHQNQVKEIGN